MTGQILEVYCLKEPTVEQRRRQQSKTTIFGVAPRPFRERAPSIPKAEFVPEDIVAVNRIDGRLTAPALAAQFASRGRLTRGDGLGQSLAQVEIAADAFGVEAIETEHGLRVVEVDGVFDLTASGDTVGIKVRKVHRQGP